MNVELQEKVLQRLEFIKDMSDKFGFTPELVSETIDDCQPDSDDALKVMFKSFEPYLGMVFGDLMKKYNATEPSYIPITTMNEDPFENLSIKKGDKVKVKLTGEAFWVEVIEMEQEPGRPMVYYAEIVNELTNTEGHGAKKGDLVGFIIGSVFEYESAKESD